MQEKRNIAPLAKDGRNTIALPNMNTVKAHMRMSVIFCGEELAGFFSKLVGILSSVPFVSWIFNIEIPSL